MSYNTIRYIQVYKVLYKVKFNLTTINKPMCFVDQSSISKTVQSPSSFICLQPTHIRYDVAYISTLSKVQELANNNAKY